MRARVIGFALCSLMLAGSTVDAAATAQLLGIKLQDSSTDPGIAHMCITVDHETFKPGRVTFQVENQSKTLLHEVLVVRDGGAKQLPVDATNDRVIESRIRPLERSPSWRQGRQAS